MNTPLENTRSLRVAIVDLRELTHIGFKCYMRDLGQHRLVLAAERSSELLSALRGGLELDVAFIFFDDPDPGTSKVLLKRMQQFHPDVRTIALFYSPDKALAEYANEAGAHTILTTREFTVVRFGKLMAELARR